RKSKRRRRSAPPQPPAPTSSDREKVIAALMALLAKRRFEQIGLAEVAGEAGLKLSQLRAEFGSTLAILAAHIKEIDRAVLAGGDVDIAAEPARERLFDVLMRRLEGLAPYKEAIRSIMRSARRSPGLAVALNAMTVRSPHWLLGAAGIRARPPAWCPVLSARWRRSELCSCSRGCWPFGWMTRSKGSPGRWRRAIAASTALSVGTDFSTIFAPCPVCSAGLGDAAGHVVRKQKLPRPERVPSIADLRADFRTAS